MLPRLQTILAASSLTLLPTFCGLFSVFAADLPTVIEITSDDHAADKISAYESRLADIASTPHMDRLAKEEALFTNAFCTNSI
jgi:N-acetylglucosamine-6-sulfatase